MFFMRFIFPYEPVEKYYSLEAAWEPAHPEAVSRPVGLPPDTAIVIFASFHAKPLGKAAVNELGL